MCEIVPFFTEILMLQHRQNTVTFTQNMTTFYYIWVGGVPQRAVLPHSPLPKCLPQVIGGVYLHVRTCAPFFYKCSACRYSVMVGPIALKLGMHLGTH